VTSIAHEYHVAYDTQITRYYPLLPCICQAYSTELSIHGIGTSLLAILSVTSYRLFDPPAQGSLRGRRCRAATTKSLRGRRQRRSQREFRNGSPDSCQETLPLQLASHFSTYLFVLSCCVLLITYSSACDDPPIRPLLIVINCRRASHTNCPLVSSTKIMRFLMLSAVRPVQVFAALVYLLLRTMRGFTVLTALRSLSDTKPSFAMPDC